MKIQSPITYRYNGEQIRPGSVSDYGLYYFIKSGDQILSIRDAIPQSDAFRWSQAGVDWILTNCDNYAILTNSLHNQRPDSCQAGRSPTKTY